MKTTSILKDIQFNEKRPVITVLFETDFTKEIRIAMQQGTVMKEHKTKFPIVVHVVEGEISFGVQGEQKELTAGDLIALDGDVPHDLSAKQNSIIRLTLTKYDDANRVKEINK